MLKRFSTSDIELADAIYEDISYGNTSRWSSKQYRIAILYWHHKANSELLRKNCAESKLEAVKAAHNLMGDVLE